MADQPNPATPLAQPAPMPPAQATPDAVSAIPPTVAEPETAPKKL